MLDALDERGDRRSTKLKNKLDDFLKEHIVLGFNSGKYDNNVVKVYLLKSLHPGITFTIKKKNNDYMCIKTKKLKFLDMKNYLAAGTSCDQFLKAYGVQVRQKFFRTNSLILLKNSTILLFPRMRHFILLSKTQTFPTKSTFCANVFGKSKR